MKRAFCREWTSVWTWAPSRRCWCGRTSTISVSVSRIRPLEVFALVFSSWGLEESILYLTNEQCHDSSYFKDSDGNALDITEKELFLEWLADNYKKYGMELGVESNRSLGCTLEFITNKSQEGAQFCKGFGGIGGILRWKIDLMSMQDDVLDEEDFF